MDSITNMVRRESEEFANLEDIATQEATIGHSNRMHAKVMVQGTDICTECTEIARAVFHLETQGRKDTVCSMTSCVKGDRDLHIMRSIIKMHLGTRSGAMKLMDKRRRITEVLHNLIESNMAGHLHLLGLKVIVKCMTHVGITRGERGTGAAQHSQKCLKLLEFNLFATKKTELISVTHLLHSRGSTQAVPS